VLIWILGACSQSLCVAVEAVGGCLTLLVKEVVLMIFCSSWYLPRAHLYHHGVSQELGHGDCRVVVTENQRGEDGAVAALVQTRFARV
jgi:hypothetical protein